MCPLRVAGIVVYATICISVIAFVFYAASCVFVAPKNLLALPPMGGKGKQTCATWFAFLATYIKSTAEIAIE